MYLLLRFTSPITESLGPTRHSRRSGKLKLNQASKTQRVHMDYLSVLCKRDGSDIRLIY